MSIKDASITLDKLAPISATNGGNGTGQSGFPDGASDESASVPTDTGDDDDDDDEMDFAAELRKRAFREKSDDDGNS